MFLVVVFLLLRVFLLSSIAKKKHKSEHKTLKQELFTFLFAGGLLIIKIVADIMQIEFLENLVFFLLSLFILSIISVFIQGKILIFYGEQVEVSGEKYFKKGYKASLFSLFLHIFSFLIGVVLCIEIFELNSLIEIGGLWAGILAFMGFTAPVWALDMIAGIILLQSKNYETGNVYYIHSLEKFIWIKSISLTEVKCIDLKISQPIIFRPSKFRDLSITNVSQGVVGKNSRVMREISIQVDYSISKTQLEELCYEAFDTLQVDLLSPESTNYFGEEPYRELVVDSFGDYAVKYSFFYTLSSPFYIFKAQKILQEYLLKFQQEKGIYFSTPDLIHLQKKETL